MYMNRILDIMNNHQLVGIGDFTHGCYEMSKFKLDLLKYLIKNTNKPIKLFVENSLWRTENIMKNKRLSYMKPTLWNGKYPNGKLGLYCGYVAESPEELETIKYIRQHRNRIHIIGVDPDIIDRDEKMASSILKQLYPKTKGINIWFAANAHVDMDKYHHHSQKWLAEPERVRYYAGYHLKKALGDEYFYILSQAYKGIVRYNGVCLGDDCYNRVANLDYIWRDFTIPEYKKYCNKESYPILMNKSEFIEKNLAFFSATYFTDLKKENQVGYSGGWYSRDIRKWDLILFFNEVTKLEQL